MLIIKKRIDIRNEIFKRLSDNLINAFVRKFKFDRHESFEAKVESL